ncbi:MAG TPA: FAD binding domain-containing protein [Terriglobia bacterium]|jgi:carbon-monoxide dehydrogenase medium subunit
MNYLRRLPKFEYLAPRNVAEACEYLTQHGREAKLLAGGTDLLLIMRRREIVPKYVIGLKNVPELDFIRLKADGSLAIGAMATCWTIQHSPVVRQRFGFLAETAADIGSIENLHVSTIGGNLCGGLPCVDLPAPLLTLEARVKLASTRGERVVPLESFFLGYERTALAPDEVLSEILIPPEVLGSGGSYIKFHDRHMIDITTTGVGAYITLDADGQTITNAKIALTTSAPVPLRVRGAEAALRGRVLTDQLLGEVVELASGEALPRSSWRSNKEFRLKLIRALVKRALSQALQRAKAAAPSADSDHWLYHPLCPRIGGAH